MRFIIMHKTNAHWEGGARPDRELIRRVGELLGELAKAERPAPSLAAAEGLRPSSEGVRIHFSGDARTVTPGPFDRGNELPSGFSILRTQSIEQAVEWASEQAEILGDREIDIRPVTEPWDIGLGPRPPDLDTRRFMVLRKATAATEDGMGSSGAVRSRLAGLIERTVRTGTHLVTEVMRPSRRGRRYTNTSNGRSFFDGPFVETKELIGGYVIVEASSLDDAGPVAERYMEVVGAEEVDVRELE
jgi:hypothetical protein